MREPPPRAPRASGGTRRLFRARPGRSLANAPTRVAPSKTRRPSALSRRPTKSARRCSACWRTRRCRPARPGANCSVSSWKRRSPAAPTGSRDSPSRSRSSVAKTISTRRPIRWCASRRVACGAISTATMSPLGSGIRSSSPFPKGGYVPHFEWREVDTAADARHLATRDRAGIGLRSLIAGAFLWAVGWLGAGLLDSTPWSDGGGNTATELPRGPKIAVLPFLSLGDDPEQAYFAQGIADQIVTDLARSKALFVLSIQSTASTRNSRPILNASDRNSASTIC
jgi:hypothetical protein